MSKYIIPLPVDVDYPSVEVSLDGTTYVLELAWNRRAGLWYMSVYLPRATSEEAIPVKQGQAMVANRPLLLGCTHPDRPLGELWIRASRDPRRYDWGSYAYLVYYDQSEGFGVPTS